VNFRDYHSLTHAWETRLDVQAVDSGVRVRAFAEAEPFYLRSAQARIEPARMWYRNYELAAETARGLDHQEDHLHAATLHSKLGIGQSVTLVASREPAASLVSAL